MQEKGYFSYLPVSLFGCVMGLSAISIAWFLLGEIFNARALNLGVFISSLISHTFYALSLISFVLLIFAYGLKLASSPQIVRQEFASPLTHPFFGTICISFLLLPIAILLHGDLNSSVLMGVAFALWAVGTITMLGFSVHIVSFWICYKQELAHITPAWIIPVVGLLDIPLAMPFWGGLYEDLAKFCIAVGMFFALVLIPLILARIIFFEKLPDKLTPTLLVVLAPFVVGFSAYGVVFGTDSFAFMLFFIGLFLFLAFLPQVFKAYRCCPFRTSWWAISFPMAALSIAALRLERYGGEFYFFLACFILIFTSGVFVWLIWRTLRGIFDGELKNIG